MRSCTVQNLLFLDRLEEWHEALRQDRTSAASLELVDMLYSRHCQPSSSDELNLPGHVVREIRASFVAESEAAYQQQLRRLCAEEPVAVHRRFSIDSGVSAASQSHSVEQQSIGGALETPRSMNSPLARLARQFQGSVFENVAKQVSDGPSPPVVIVVLMCVLQTLFVLRSGLFSSHGS